MKTTTVTFGDKRLDADLTAVLGLEPTKRAPSRAGSPLRRLRRSRTASATITASLSLAVLAGAAFLVDRGMPEKRDVRVREVPASAPYVDAAPVPADPVAVATVRPSAAAAPRDPAAPRRLELAASPSRAAAIPKKAVTSVASEPAENAAERSAPAIAAPSVGEARDVAAVAPDTAPAAAREQAEPASTAVIAPSTRARRDSVDAIRALRRQF